MGPTERCSFGFIGVRRRRSRRSTLCVDQVPNGPFVRSVRRHLCASLPSCEQRKRVRRVGGRPPYTHYDGTDRFVVFVDARSNTPRCAGDEYRVVVEPRFPSGGVRALSLCYEPVHGPPTSPLTTNHSHPTNTIPPWGPVRIAEKRNESQSDSKCVV